MANERGKETFPSAEMLARKAAEMDGDPKDVNIWEVAAHDFLILTLALASLQADHSPKDAPERVKLTCWYVAELDSITLDFPTAHRWQHDLGYTVTEGYFTAKGSTE